MLNRISLAILTFSLLLVTFTGCKKQEASAPGEKQEAPAAMQHDHAGHDHEGHDHHGGEGHDHGDQADGGDNGFPPSSEADKADPRANKLIEPPIEAADVPKGAFYCDMGAVHYYRFEKGDGKCAVCGMPLKEKE